MGNFYVNHTVRAPQQAVVALLKKEGCTAYVSPTIQGYTVIYDRDCDHQNTFAINDLGLELSKSLRSPVVAFLNHDDDILCYWVFDQGRVLEEYNSCPDYFDEEGMDFPPEVLEEMEDYDSPGLSTEGTELCRLFGDGTAKQRKRVRSILKSPETAFAVFMHQKLVDALELPRCTVGAGYRYVRQGDVSLDDGEFVHVSSRRGPRRTRRDEAK